MIGAAGARVAAPLGGPIYAKRTRLPACINEIASTVPPAERNAYRFFFAALPLFAALSAASATASTGVITE